MMESIDNLNNFSPSEQELAANLPLRRDLVTLLIYLRDHRAMTRQQILAFSPGGRF